MFSDVLFYSLNNLFAATCPLHYFIWIPVPNNNYRHIYTNVNNKAFSQHVFSISLADIWS